MILYLFQKTLYMLTIWRSCQWMKKSTNTLIYQVWDQDMVSMRVGGRVGGETETERACVCVCVCVCVFVYTQNVQLKTEAAYRIHKPVHKLYINIVYYIREHSTCWCRCCKWPPATLRHAWHLLNILLTDVLKLVSTNCRYCIPDYFFKFVFCEWLCVCVHAQTCMYFYIDVWETSIQIVVTLHLICKQAGQKGLLINYLVPKNVMQVGCWIVGYMGGCTV